MGRTPSFRGDEAGQRLWRADVETGRGAPGIGWIGRDRLMLHDLGDAIDMARDQMAAQFVANLQRAFQIDALAGLPAARQGLRQRLRRRLDMEDAARLAIAARRERRDREAHARAGDRGADVDAGRVKRAGDRQPAQVFAGLPGLCDHADGFDDACEHHAILS